MSHSEGGSAGMGGSRGGVVKPADAVEAQPLTGARATRIQFLVGPDDGAPNFIMRRIIMEEAGGMPAHTNAVEHEQYVLRGRARIGIDDEVHEVGANDTLFIAAGTPHWYEVIEAPFEFICVVPNTPDRIRRIEGGRWSRGRALLLAAMACLALACGGGGVGENATNLGSTASTTPMTAATLQRLAASDGVRLVDLTYPLSPDSLYWPTGSPFEHQILDWGINDKGYWYASAAFSSPEHLGTHLDAPIHFAEHGWTAAEIPIDRLFAAGVLVDISARSAEDADATLQPDDLTAWEAEHGPIPAEAAVIVRTGWAAKWPDWNEYYGSPTPKDVSTLHFPGVSVAAARALVERRAAAVGIDTASIDPGISTDFEAHQVLSAGSIFNLENLTRIDELPASGFVVVALPMKIAKGTGGPTRVVALLPGG
ncbi:MAG: cyclase family protein [Acidobacteriota bacterium]